MPIYQKLVIVALIAVSGFLACSQIALADGTVTINGQTYLIGRQTGSNTNGSRGVYAYECGADRGADSGWVVILVDNAAHYRGSDCVPWGTTAAAQPQAPAQPAQAPAQPEQAPATQPQASAAQQQAARDQAARQAAAEDASRVAPKAAAPLAQATPTCSAWQRFWGTCPKPQNAQPSLPGIEAPTPARPTPTWAPPTLDANSGLDAGAALPFLPREADCMNFRGHELDHGHLNEFGKGDISAGDTEVKKILGSIAGGMTGKIKVFMRVQGVISSIPWKGGFAVLIYGNGDSPTLFMANRGWPQVLEMTVQSGYKELASPKAPEVIKQAAQRLYDCYPKVAIPVPQGEPELNPRRTNTVTPFKTTIPVMGQDCLEGVMYSEGMPVFFVGMQPENEAAMARMVAAGAICIVITIVIVGSGGAAAPVGVPVMAAIVVAL